MHFDLVALDLDDTLLHTDLSISDANREALARSHRCGAKVVLASGRNIYSMRRYVELLGLRGPDDYIIATNGGEIVESATDKVLDETRLPTALCYEVASEIEARGFPWQIYDDGVIYHHGWSEWTAEDSRLTGQQTLPLADPGPYFERRTLKIVVPGDPALMPGLLSEICAHFRGRAEVLISKPCFLEVLPLGVNKGVGLARLASRLGIPLERCIAMGDAMNDIDMLREAGFSCAPANAVPAAKEAAKWVSPLSNDEDFVADALGRWMGYA